MVRILQVIDTANHVELLSVDVNGQTKHGMIYGMGAGMIIIIRHLFWLRFEIIMI